MLIPLSLTLCACHPKVLRPDPRACVVPAAVMVARPLPVLAGKTWRDVADYAARAGDHAQQREADITVIAGLCKRP